MKIEKKELVEIGRYLKDIIKKAATGNGEAIAIDGGNVVGPQISDAIFSQNEYKGIGIWDMVKKVKTLKGPQVKIRSRVNALASEPSTGIRSYWVAEADASTLSKIDCNGKTVDLAKLVCRVPVTGELDADVSNFADVFLQDASESMLYKIEKEILMGFGSIKGVMTVGDEATMGVTVSGDVPTEAELQLFVSALHPMATNAKWYVNKEVYLAITKIAYTTPNAIQFEDEKYFIFGYEVVLTPQLIDTPYNICLGDFSKYSVAYIEPKFDRDEDIRFEEDEIEYRLSLRIGGDTYCKNSDLDDGFTYGFFVTNVAGEATQSSSSSSESSCEYSSESSSSESSSSEG
jgi:HK97 family phage major capsid protein